jgi:hypothetical protein
MTIFNHDAGSVYENYKRKKRSKQHLEEIGAKTTKRLSREEQVIEKP